MNTLKEEIKALKQKIKDIKKIITIKQKELSRENKIKKALK